LKQSLTKISLFILIASFFASCNPIKRVKEDEHLLTKNSIHVNNKKNNSEVIKNLLYQKENSKLLGIPVRLHFYNLAMENSDSILDEKLKNKLKEKSFAEKLYSKKQLIEWTNYKKGFQNRLKNTGEAPVIYDENKTKKSIERLKSYYINHGWFNTDATYNFKEIGEKRANVSYKVTTGEPYIIDSITYKISSPKIDSIFKTFKDKSFVNKNEQYKTLNFEEEQNRLTNNLRNSGFYHFNQDYVFFEMDTIGTNKKVNVEVQIHDRIIKNEDSTIRKPFNIYKIKEVNIFTDDKYENRNKLIKDSTNFNGFNLLSHGKLKYKPKALTDAIFITPDQIFKDRDRTSTYRHINNLNTFKYPNIDYVEADSTNLIANIYLIPRKKYSVGFDFDITQSNIQTVGFAFSTSLLTRNVFRGAETLEISAIGSIGASKDASDSKDQFFDINEIGVDLKLTIPRLFSPFNTEKIIPKHMSPLTRISLGATSQKNIGLDKQTLNGILNYKWNHSSSVTNRLDLTNIEYVKNLNTDNYFGVYQNSFNSLNEIAQSTGYIDDTETLSIPEEADAFINNALSENPSFIISDDDIQTVNNIDERKERLTEDNLIFASNFSYTKDKRESLFDNNFSILRLKLELAGNLFSSVSKVLNFNKNSDDRYEFMNVAYSQYVKTEIDYIKYWHLGGGKVLAMRNFFGFAIPYGNSGSIPFSKSFFAGGANDNRAWTAYNLGPGSTNSRNEFNEANLKLAFSLEYRYNLFKSVNGAFFIDAGNIWNALDDVEDSKATFSGIESLKDTAVGAGFGIRYDLKYFVARLDIGFKAHDPSFENRNRWFKIFNFKNAVYNIGINYPF